MSPLERLQIFIAGRLAATGFFSDVGVYVLRPRTKADGTLESVPDIQTKIEEALSLVTTTEGKFGAAISVQMPEIAAENGDNSGFVVVQTVIRCEENPTLNMSADGTRKSAEELGTAVISALWGWVPGGVSQPIYFAKEAMVPNLDKPARVVYDVVARANMQLEEEERVTRVVIARSSETAPAEITLTCATVGAAIYYTTDGTFPSAQNPAAVEYTEPFTVETSADIFAAAYMDGLAGSNVSAVEIG